MAVRRWSWLPAILVLASTAVVAGCGGGPTTLGVSLSLLGGSHSSQLAPGETATFTITVTDTGPSGTAGVTVSAHLPAAFRYKDTQSLASGTGVRTDPVDAQVNSSQPQWGVWELGGHGDTVEIVFTAVAGGQPGSYSVTADASGSSTGTTTSEGVNLTLLSAPELSAQVSVSPNTASPGEEVTYQLTVINSGTGVASGVEVLVTLPPVAVYAGGLQILGNASRSGGTDPAAGSIVPYFSGFNIPPHSGSSPGELELRFGARILTDAGALGTYPIGVQVIADSDRYQVQLPAAAPLQVT